MARYLPYESIANQGITARYRSQGVAGGEADYGSPRGDFPFAAGEAVGKRVAGPVAEGEFAAAGQGGKGLQLGRGWGPDRGRGEAGQGDAGGKGELGHCAEKHRNVYAFGFGKKTQMK